MLKKDVLLFIGLKAGLLAIVFGLVLLHVHILGAPNTPIWFDPQYTNDQIREELERTKGAGVDTARNSLGQTGLMAAIIAADYSAFVFEGEPFERVKLLVKYGADVNAVSNAAPREEDHSYNNTPLHYAALQNNNIYTVDMIHYLIDMGAHVNVQNSLGETPLMWSIDITDFNRRKEATRALIEDLADVNMQNNLGMTYLHLPIKIVDIAWVQYLMETYGSMFDLTLKNREGKTAEEYASSELQTDIVNAIKNRRKIGIGDNVHEVDALGRNGLMLAVIRDDLPFAKRQIEYRADMDAKDRTRFENAALHFAAMRRYHMSPYVQLLAQKGANPNIKNKYGETPLHYLLKYNLHAPDRDVAAKALIDAGANIKEENNVKESVIKIAETLSPPFAKKLQKWAEEKK